MSILESLLHVFSKQCTVSDGFLNRSCCHETAAHYFCCWRGIWKQDERDAYFDELGFVACAPQFLGFVDVPCGLFGCSEKVSIAFVHFIDYLFCGFQMLHSSSIAPHLLRRISWRKAFSTKTLVHLRFSLSNGVIYCLKAWKFTRALKDVSAPRRQSRKTIHHVIIARRLVF